MSDDVQPWMQPDFWTAEACGQAQRDAEAIEQLLRETVPVRHAPPSLWSRVRVTRFSRWLYRIASR